MMTLPARRAPRPKDTDSRPWQCTKPQASFCPLCGTCTCGPVAVSLGVITCPLHGRSARHGARVGWVA